MNVNKKLDRFKQWAGERMGGEVKTNLSDDFKALETEMNVKHEGGQDLLPMAQDFLMLPVADIIHLSLSRGRPYS
jgi:hypothetical protein